MVHRWVSFSNGVKVGWNSIPYRQVTGGGEYTILICTDCLDNSAISGELMPKRVSCFATRPSVFWIIQFTSVKIYRFIQGVGSIRIPVTDWYELQGGGSGGVKDLLWQNWYEKKSTKFSPTFLRILTKIFPTCIFLQDLCDFYDKEFFRASRRKKNTTKCSSKYHADFLSFSNTKGAFWFCECGTQCLHEKY